jgi:hypothetical protein
LCKDIPDGDFDEALFDLLVQACTLHVPTDCGKFDCEICISLSTMQTTLASIGFGTNLLRRAPLWILLYCCLIIKKFELGTNSGTRNGKNFLRVYSGDSKGKKGKVQKSFYDISPDVLDKTIRRIKTLVEFVDHVVSCLSNVRFFKDVPPLQPFEHYVKKHQVIQSVESQFGERLKQSDAANRWICCNQNNFCFVLKMSNEMANVHYHVNITKHKWFQPCFKSRLLYVGVLPEQPVRQKRAAKMMKRDCGSTVPSASSKIIQVDDDDDDSDDVQFHLSSSELTEFRVLARKEYLGKKLKYGSIIYCIRQLILEQQNLWHSIELQRQYIRQIEKSLDLDKQYFEYLSTSPTPAPSFSSNYSKLSMGRVKCNHCNMTYVADSMWRHMKRKHPDVIPKITGVLRVNAKQMPEKFRNAFLKVRCSAISAVYRHPHFFFPVAGELRRIFK